MTAVPLFDEPRARRTDPQTSRDAAGRMRAAAPSLTRQILDAFATNGPMTDRELCKALGADPERWPSIKTARSRLSPGPKKPDPKLIATGVVWDGMQVWALRDWSNKVEFVQVQADFL